MSVYLLYEGKATHNQSTQKKVEMQMFPVKPFGKQGKGRIANFYWWFVSRKPFLCEIRDAETKELMHYTYVMKKSYKFPFMKPNDYMIGPSVTIERFRGRGLLSAGIVYAQNEILFLDGKARFIALIREENCSSRKGFEKSGMINTGKQFVKNKLKIYREVIERTKE